MRDATLREAKTTLRQWFASQDAGYLTRVFSECREGIFCFADQCHCLLGLLEGGYKRREEGSFGRNAELALCNLEIYGDRNGLTGEARRVRQAYLGRQRILAMVLAEIRRRTKSQVAEPVAVHAGRQP